MKSILRFCVRRPLGVLAVYAALCAAGVMSWVRMPRELLPDLSFPRLSVVTVFPNASPEEVENLVTKPVEQALGTVKNVRRVESSSKEQVSVVDAEFRWETDMDAALLWVQEKLGLTQDQLPLEARRPVVLRYNPFDRPVLLVSVSGHLPAADLQRLVELRLKPRLEKVAGVSSVEVGGARAREIQIDLDAQRLHAHGLSVLDVAEALRRRNVSRSAGTATEGLYEYPVTVSGSFTDLRGVREAVLRLGDGEEASRKEPAAPSALLRLENLGAVTDGFRESSSHARYDGSDNISVGVYKRSEAFPMEVSRGGREALEELRRQLPASVRLEVIYDQSVFIQEGIGHVVNDVVLGGALAYLVLWSFLKNRKRAAIVGGTIPVALVLTIAILHRMGFTVNLLVLGGLALGVGMLVDAAVVIMENISRHMEAGRSVEESVVEGGGEVGKAVFFCVMTHLAAFAPIPVACVGVSQRVFGPICVAVLTSQVCSLVTSFTLVPALMSLAFARGGLHLPRAGGLQGFLSRWRSWEALRRAARTAGTLLSPLLQRGRDLSRALKKDYEEALSWAVHRRRHLLGLSAAATAVSAALLLFAVPKEAMPDVDQDQFLLQLTMPAGTRLAVTDRVARRIEEALAGVPEAAHRNVLVGSPQADLPGAQGPHQAQIVVDLADRVPAGRPGRTRKRRRCRLVMREVSRKVQALDLEGGKAALSAQGSDVFSQVFGKGEADLVVEVKGQDMDKMKEAVSAVTEGLRKISGVAKVSDSLSVPSPQVSYRLDEVKLARDGLSVADVAELVLAAVHGQVPTKFREKGREIDVRVRLREKDRSDPAALSGLVVPSPLGGSGHPLSEYGSLSLAPGPSEVRRRDQSRVILVKASLSGRRLSEAMPEVRKLLGARRGDDVTVSLGGEVEESRASLESLLYGFAASVALVYIVLVAQFNTLWVPFVAMAAVPLSLIGVAPALILTGHTLNLMSGQGLVMLAGVVVNNSLMLLEFIAQRREEGEAPERAAVDASHERLRPILMTVIATVAGLLPLALSLGKGTEIQAPMAVTVIFGLIVSTVLTLVVMPALYLEARAFFEKRNG